MATQSNSNKSGVQRVSGFFKSTKAEMKKVSWPNRKELINYTIVVFVICGLMSLLVWGLDTGFHKLVGLIAK